MLENVCVFFIVKCRIIWNNMFYLKRMCFDDYVIGVWNFERFGFIDLLLFFWYI